MSFTEPALYSMDGNSDGFEWIQFTSSDENIVAFLRKTEKKNETLLVVCNFSPVSYDSYHVGVPFAGKYKEIFNSDNGKYGGQGVINARAKASVQEECDARKNSLKLKLPAYGVAVFTCTEEKIVGKTVEKAKETATEKTSAVKKAVRKVTARKKKTSVKKQ